MKSLFVLISCFVLLLFLISTFANTPQKQSFNKTVVSDYAEININNIITYATNYGSFFRNPITGNAGFEWPRGSGNHAIYAAGLMMGAKVKGELRVAAAQYQYEFVPGTIDRNTRLPSDPADPDFRIYKIIPYDTFSTDYRQWPVQHGAPIDKNGKPLILGGQTVWCVYNDADPHKHSLTDTEPLGIEVRQTVFGYPILGGTLGNFLLLHWLIINQSPDTLNDAYFSIWSDPDLGDAGDDFIGCDTLGNLGFCYNASDYDNEYGNHPPAVGFSIFQGPIIPSLNDTAMYMGKRITGFKNLPMTSFVKYYDEYWYYGHYGISVYNSMQGLWGDGSPITYGGGGWDPNNPPTKFMYSGDPESGEGWLDSLASDRRMMVSSGPFTMAPHDSQEIVAGVLIMQGMSHLNSVTILKQQMGLIKEFYQDSLYKLFTGYRVLPQVIRKYHLFQNYPNPFNDQTIIQYQIPEAQHVKLEIYNVLGQKIATLVNGFQDSDRYQIRWDARGLPSGFYFYRLQVGPYVRTRKLLLIK